MSSQTNPGSGNYTLYFHPYSICSLMVRYTLSIRGEPISPDVRMTVEEHELDVFHEAQMEEDFLCEINPLGQVPVLARPGNLERPIADSLDITTYLASTHPSLIPMQHEAPIQELLGELHSLNYFSLSFPGRPALAHGLKAAVERRLANPSISDRYRKALEYKLTVVKKSKVAGVQPATVAQMEGQAREFLQKIEAMVSDNPTQWIFGGEATALDAHLVVFLARMTDVKREALLPDQVKRYRDWAFRSPGWQRLMEGRTTMVAPPSST